MNWLEYKSELEMNKKVSSFECMTTLVTLILRLFHKDTYWYLQHLILEFAH